MPRRLKKMPSIHEHHHLSCLVYMYAGGPAAPNWQGILLNLELVLETLSCRDPTATAPGMAPLAARWAVALLFVLLGVSWATVDDGDAPDLTGGRLSDGTSKPPRVTTSVDAEPQ